VYNDADATCDACIRTNRICGPKVSTAGFHKSPNPNVRYNPYPEATSTYSKHDMPLPLRLATPTSPATSHSIVEQVTLGTTPAVPLLSQVAAAIEQRNPDRATDVQYIYSQLRNDMYRFTQRPEWHSSTESLIPGGNDLRQLTPPFPSDMSLLNPDRETGPPYPHSAPYRGSNYNSGSQQTATFQPLRHQPTSLSSRADIELRPSDPQFLQKPQSDSISITHLEPQIARRSDPMERFHGISFLDDMEEVVNSNDGDRPTYPRPRNPTTPMPSSEG